VLVLRRCCLGDVLMTTPLLAALDEAWPEARITYAVGHWSAPALANNPRVDRTILLPERPTLRQWTLIVGGLRRGRFALAILPERSPLVGLAALLAGIPRRVGLDSAGRGFALTDPVAVRGVRHEVERALDLARALGLPVSSRRMEYRPGAAAEDRVERLLSRRGVRTPIFVVHPGGGANPGVTMASKRWRPERFAAVADVLGGRHDGTVVVVGAASDRPAVAAMVAALRGEAIDLCGAPELDLAGLGALCRRAALYLGNDSGTTHLAEACGAPTVAIFGPTDPAMYGPFDGTGEAVAPSSPDRVARGDLTRLAGDDLANRAIDAVTVAQVLQAAERVLARDCRTRTARS
jgi:ADP-heptose:LPS heptosyltransferase